MTNPIRWVVDIETGSVTGNINLSVLLAMTGLLHLTGISAGLWEFSISVPPFKHYLFLGFLLIVSLIVVVCHFYIEQVHELTQNEKLEENSAD